MSSTRSSLARLVLNGVDEPSHQEPPPQQQQYHAEPSSSSAGATKYSTDVSQPSKEKQIDRRSDDSLSNTTSGAEASNRYRLIVPEDMDTADTTTSIIQSLVNPATVPIRTSSRSSSINGDNRTANTTSPGKTPKKHHSMASVPEEQRKHYHEVDERQWIAQSRQNRNTVSGGSHSAQPSSSFSPPRASESSSNDPLRSGVGADLVSGISLGWSSEKENILKGPFNYLESHPGKDIRTQLITGFNSWLQVPSSSLRIITGVVTMLHTASLLIDDVEDSSLLRRGVPVAHSIFGTAQAINSANYVYFCALQELLKLNNPEAIRIYTDELLNLHRGQGMDLFWRDTLTCPSEDDYLEMVGNKTGGLFRLAIKLMCAESPSHHFTPSGSPAESEGQVDYIPLVNTIGLLFQILDDYKNLSSSTYTANKGLCEDLTEGKFSFPIIHSIRSDPSNLVLINILKQKTQDEDVKRYAVSYMERTGSFTYTRRVIRGLVRKAMGLLEEVDGGRGRGEGIREVLERLGVERGEKQADRGAERRDVASRDS